MTGLMNPQAAVQPLEQSPGYWQSVLNRLLQDKVALGAGSVILVLFLMALLGPYIVPADPYQSSILGRLKPMGSPGFPLGSDQLGRDMLSRLIVGARLSLLMGLMPVMFAFIFGTGSGPLAGTTAAKAVDTLMSSILGRRRVRMRYRSRKPSWTTNKFRVYLEQTKHNTHTHQGNTHQGKQAHPV